MHLITERAFLTLASVSAHSDSLFLLHYPHASSVRYSGTHLYSNKTHDARRVCTEDLRSILGSHSYPSLANMEISVNYMNRAIEHKTNGSPTPLPFS